MEKQLRIALCISGQPRTWKRCYQSWYDSISHLGQVDSFFHMWNFNTLPSYAAGLMKDPLRDTLVSDEEMLEIIDTLKPKAYEFQPKIDLPGNRVINPIAWWTRPQFYGIKRCAFIKRKYEIENNFDYDAVFRIRTDLFLEHKITLQSNQEHIRPNSVYSCVNQHDREFRAFRIGDVFYYADSFTYDQSANFYECFDYIDSFHVIPGLKDYPPELAFYFFLKSIGINNIYTRVDHKIVRTEEYAKIKGKLDTYEI